MQCPVASLAHLLAHCISSCWWALHWSATIMKLSVTLLMTGVRAFVRRSLATNPFATRCWMDVADVLAGAIERLLIRFILNNTLVWGKSFMGNNPFSEPEYSWYVPAMVQTHPERKTTTAAKFLIAPKRKPRAFSDSDRLHLHGVSALWLYALEECNRHARSNPQTLKVRTFGSSHSSTSFKNLTIRSDFDEMVGEAHPVFCFHAWHK